MRANAQPVACGLEFGYLAEGSLRTFRRKEIDVMKLDIDRAPADASCRIDFCRCKLSAVEIVGVISDAGRPALRGHDGKADRLIGSR